jgi:DNA end-binding protein Ku
MRATGSATIQFGLVSIPVQVCTATVKGAEDVKFERVSDKTMRKFKQVYVDDDGHVLGKGATAVYGVFAAPDKFVPVPGETIQAIDEQFKIKTLAIDSFVDAYQVEPHLYRGFDYLQPQKGAEYAFGLFAAALKATNAVAVTKWTPRSRVTTYVIRATDDALILQELYYASEIRKPDAKVSGPIGRTVRPDELELAKQIINAQMRPEFEHDKIVDDKAEARRKLIDEALKGVKIGPPAAEKAVERPVSDLAELLKRSVTT